jgi:hypothetical protein
MYSVKQSKVTPLKYGETAIFPPQNGRLFSHDTLKCLAYSVHSVFSRSAGRIIFTPVIKSVMDKFHWRKVYVIFGVTFVYMYVWELLAPKYV